MILIVDDDKIVRVSLRLVLGHAGHDALVARTPDEALEAVRTQPLRLVISDMNFSNTTSGQEGLELLRKIKVLRPGLPVILITAWGSIPLAVEGMRLGAFDFVTKPWDNRLLLQRVETALAVSRPPAEQQEGAFDRCGIVGRSPQILDVLDTVRRIAPTDASVLITGENGTGKELVARALHVNSRRASGPFVKVNLGGMPQSLFESEMFGSAKGAYTGAAADRKGRFETADTGTIFLDEIGDLDMASQVKMLRVLQEHTFERLGESRPRKVDIRVVSATNADLPSMVRDHTFREDLYYRINLITLHLPALRQRRGDIPLLVEHFASMCDRKVIFTPGAMEALADYDYPGNIRQLRNIVERLALMARSDEISADDVLRALPAPGEHPAESVLEARERTAVREALDRCGGNVSQAAVFLGVTRQTLYRRMRKFGIAP